MKTTYFQRRALIIAANVTFISFTIIGATTATYAWFTSNTVVSAKGMSVKCAVPGASLNYEILKYDDQRLIGVSYGQNPAEFNLPAYDQYIPSKNYYCNAIIVATLSCESFTPSDQLDISITCSGSYKANNKIASNTSNVVAFKSFVYSYTSGDVETVVTTLDTTSDNTRYESATAIFNGMNTSNSFINGTTKSTNISSHSDAGAGTYSATTIKFYLECSYNASLVSAFIDDVGYSMEGTIDLVDDITAISIDKEAK